MAVLSSAKSIEALKEFGYHTCTKALYLQVAKQGTKSWLFRYTSPIKKMPNSHSSVELYEGGNRQLLAGHI